MHEMTHVELDVSGVIDPLPVLRLKAAMKDVPIGGTVRMVSTDPCSPPDVDAYCRMTGHVLLSSQTTGGRFTFLIQRF